MKNIFKYTILATSIVQTVMLGQAFYFMRMDDSSIKEIVREGREDVIISQMSLMSEVFLCTFIMQIMLSFIVARYLFSRAPEIRAISKTETPP